MKPTIKICGLCSVNALQCISALGIEYAGFVLTNSPRQLDETRLGELLSALDRCVTPVAVLGYDTQKLSFSPERLRTMGISTLQLHGEVPPALCQTLRQSGFTVIRAVDPDPQKVRMYASVADVLLIEAPHVDRLHATAPMTLQQWQAVQQAAGGTKLWLSGGLTPQNVGALVRACRPDGVDVSSGVESSVGVKSPEKIAAFVEEVRR
ncbi:MAG: phosphoribosylanthranilate isomerase [Firmicutes bacterium]|nr:phosphoribosylanthranilate isomerase [Bacillota bacterium]